MAGWAAAARRHFTTILVRYADAGGIHIAAAAFLMTATPVSAAC